PCSSSRRPRSPRSPPSAAYRCSTRPCPQNLRATAALGCLASLSLGLELLAELNKGKLRGRLAGWNLPTNLNEKLDTLDDLSLPDVATLDWLSMARHVHALTVSGVRSLQDSLLLCPAVFAGAPQCPQLSMD